MTELSKLPPPVVGRGASLDADQAGRLLLEERQHAPSRQPQADDHLAGCVDTVNDKDRLRDIHSKS